MKVKPLDPVAVAAARRVLLECDVQHARDINAPFLEHALRVGPGRVLSWIVPAA